jgi:hypothetical protein
MKRTVLLMICTLTFLLFLGCGEDSSSEDVNPYHDGELYGVWELQYESKLYYSFGENSSEPEIDTLYVSPDSTPPTISFSAEKMKIGTDEILDWFAIDSVLLYSADAYQYHVIYLPDDKTFDTMTTITEDWTYSRWYTIVEDSLRLFNTIAPSTHGYDAIQLYTRE